MTEQDIKLQDPCIGVCSKNPESGQCYGCQRTQEEIESWLTLDNDAKRNLFDILEKRRDELFGD